ncbi:MAG: hypothetical protein MK111_08695 [Crocosphaera sp.]|nr:MULTISPECIES: hypothetical protein [Crocosphaera]MCH2244704.1 hypothetical protein [Crocosphaera sp.]NQZ64810.1 hypothetical protein [Crocosphaera sp.]
MTELVVWPLLSTCSKRAMVRTKKRWGHPNEYHPRQKLINRLSDQLKMSKQEVLNQIEKERDFLTRHSHYFS